MADYFARPYYGLHNEPYPEFRPPPNKGWVKGLLDSLTPDVNTARGVVGLLGNMSLRQRPPDISTGDALKVVADATPIGPLIDVATQSDAARSAAQGGDSYGTGQSVGDILKTVAMAFVPGSKGATKKVPGLLGSFETAAPKGGHRSGLSLTTYPTSVDDMTFGRTPNAPMVPPKVISPETMQGGLIMPLVGDRTMAGHRLDSINGQPLAFPVNLQGGPNFMRGPQQIMDEAFWASNESAPTTLTNRFTRAVETGKPVYGVYTGMSSRGGDYSHMMSDALLAQTPNAKISQQAKIDFDTLMKTQDKDWPGLDNTLEARKRLLDSGPLRKFFVENMADKKWQGQGFPEIASTRAAITEPALLREPGSPSGLTVARVTDPKVVDAPAVPHATYPGQIVGGQYAGGFEKSLPRSEVWPDAFRQMEQEPKLRGDSARQDYTFTRRDYVQEATQQWVDRLMRRLRGQGS